MRFKTSRVVSLASVAILAMVSFGISLNAALGPADTTNPDQAALSKEVDRQLQEVPYYGVFDTLQYSVQGNTVTLSGEVTQPVLKDDALKAVRNIKGVGQVVDNIEVLPNYQYDWKLRREEFRAIFSNSNLGRYSEGAVPAIHIIVKNGRVTLVGQVMNNMDKEIAGMMAGRVSGAFSVTNNLQVHG